MEYPSALQQPQRPNRWGAMAPGTSESSRVGGLTTSGSSSKSFWMEGGAGDGSSWYDWVTRAEAGLGACKRKKTDAEQQAPGLEVETSIAKSEEHLKESQMREEEARQQDRGQSDSSKEQDRDVVVEGAEGSGPTGAEAIGPLRSQDAEPTMEVDVGDIPPLTSEDTTTVTPEEDEMLTGDPTSVAGEMVWLQVAPPESHEPEDGATS